MPKKIVDRKKITQSKNNQILNAYNSLDILKGKKISQLSKSDSDMLLTAICQILRVCDPSGAILGKIDPL